MITILPTRCYWGFPIRCWEEACCPIRRWGAACCPIGSPWAAACRIRRSSWAAALPFPILPVRPSWAAACCRSSPPARPWAATRSLPSCSGRRRKAGPYRQSGPCSRDRRILHVRRDTVATAHVGVAENSLDIEGPCSNEIIIDRIVVPDLDTKGGVATGIQEEGVTPSGLLASELANLCSELLSSEVDLAVGVLDGRGGTILSMSSVSWVRLALMGRTRTDIGLVLIISLEHRVYQAYTLRVSWEESGEKKRVTKL